MASEGLYESYQAEEILTWAVQRFGESITFACSFGAEDVVLIDMLAQVKPDIDIFFLDTDLHFKETYETIERLKQYYGRTFTPVKTDLTLHEQEHKYGSQLWLREPDLCCSLRKVEPLKKYLSHFNAWITGIRREQSPTRANTKKVELDSRNRIIKVNPLADWSHKDVWRYIHKYQLPYNPLHDQRYPSIGCAVCTSPVPDGQDLRSGRWNGFAKTECGLHK